MLEKKRPSGGPDGRREAPLTGVGGKRFVPGEMLCGLMKM
jgi:hypothetical protein